MYLKKYTGMGFIFASLYLLIFSHLHAQSFFDALDNLFSSEDFQKISQDLEKSFAEEQKKESRARDVVFPKPQPQKQLLTPLVQPKNDFVVQDQKTLFLNDYAGEKLPKEIKKAYNHYMQKTTDFLKSIEKKSFQILPETIVLYSPTISSLVISHSEIKNQDDDLIPFFSPKMKEFRQNIVKTLPLLEKLDGQLTELIQLKSTLSESEKEQLEKFSQEKTLEKLKSISQHPVKAGIRTGITDTVQVPSQEQELILIEEKEKKKEEDSSKGNGENK